MKETELPVDASVHDRAANLILDALEDAFQIAAPDGRRESHTAIVNILQYFYDLPDPQSHIVGRKARALDWLSDGKNYGRQIQHWYGERSLLDAVEEAIVMDALVGDR